MVKPSASKQAAWLGGVVLVVTFASCRDFDVAYSQCVDAGLCGPGNGGDGGLTDGGNTGTDGGNTGTDGGNTPGTDGGGNPGTDGGGTPGTDAGVDAGTNPPVELEPGDCDTLFCLRDRLTLMPSSSLMGFTGLWGSGPHDVFLAYGAPEVIRFDGQFTTTTLSGLNNARPARLHGSGPDSVWGINAAGTGPMTCSTFGLGPTDAPSELLPDAGTEVPDAGTDVPDAGTGIPDAGTGAPCPSPLVRYDQGIWTLATEPGAGPSIRPPALLTLAQDSTWVASDRGGALHWNGSTWTEEPASTPDAGVIHAMWAGGSGLPEFGVGKATVSAGFGAYWLREGTGTWTGPQMATASPPMFGIALEAIAGPSVDHLYAVGGQTVLRWQSPAWSRESLPFPLPTGCVIDSAQDVWVSSDGTDVWVAFRSACALRKRGGTWSAVRLPVPADFQALQVEGFLDTSSVPEVMNLWITGFQPSTSSAIAYRFELK